MKATSIERWLVPYGAQPPWGTSLTASVLAGTTLLLGTCSRTKKPVPQGTPAELYGSWPVRLLDTVCRRNGLRYGVLSDEYGIVLDTEVVRQYDTPPEAVSEDGFKRLGGLVRDKLAGLKPTRVCLFTFNPMRTIPYCKILKYSGIPYTWTPSVEWLRELGGSTLFGEE